MLSFEKKLSSNFIIFYIIFVVDFTNFCDVNAKTNDDEHLVEVFNADNDLMLICDGSIQLNWTSTMEDSNQEDNSSTAVFDESTNSFPAKLIIPTVMFFKYNLLYTCKNMDGDENRSVDIKLTSNENFAKYENSNQNIAIACCFKSQDINFEEQNCLQAPNFMAYISKRGASIEISEEEKYNCTNQFEENFEIIIRYKKQTFKNVERPTLKDESEQPHVAGRQLKLSCMMKLDDNKEVTWRWDLPRGVQIGDSRLKLDCSKNNITTLTLTNLSIYDSGYYTCNCKTDSQNITSQTIIVNVIDRPRVTLNGPSYILLNTSTDFVCKADGYPTPKIYWSFKCLRSEECPQEKMIPGGLLKNERSFELKAKSTYTLNTNVSGTLICGANNTEGNNSTSKEVIVTDIPKGLGFNVWKETIDGIGSLVIVGDTVVLQCAASKHNYSGSLEWYLDKSNKPLTSNDAYEVYNDSTEYSYRKIIKISNVTEKYEGLYRCEYGSKSKAIDLYVYEPVAVTIYDTNLENKELIMHVGSYLKFYCRADGIPITSITWKMNGKVWVPDNKRTTLVDQDYGDVAGQEIYFNYTIKDDEGNYSCEASNRFGKAVKSSLLSIVDDKAVSTQHNTLTWLIIAPILCFIILIIAVTFFYIKLRNKNSRIAELKNAGIYHFDEGDVHCINPALTIDDQADLLPYNNEWEFPREKLKLGKVLGAGAFGVVMKAEAQGISNGESCTTVAVKMVQRNADVTYVKALASELKIMVHLGLHVNVVNLLGACTKKLSNIRELCIIVEYCCYGNMLNYLQRHRRDFINQIDPLTGNINTAIGQDILASSGSASAKRSESEIPNLRNSNENTCNTEVNILATSTGEDDVTIVSNYTTQQPELRLNYQGDYRGNFAPMSSQDLLCWAFQIARGMEYLVSRHVLHGDLAARNVLLADNYVVKISDFGLAKSMYKNDNYVKSKNSPLPIKWMALESIRDRIFSVRSDVWSYGIVLWELFSLGQTPYPGMNVDEIFFQKLQDGYRLSKPEFATKELYQVMLQCWEARPKNRPLFDKLVDDIGLMLENNVRQHYINLNSPYVMMNQKKNKGHTDYLDMMSSPDVDKSGSTRYTNELPSPSNHEINSDSNAGYLCMTPKPALINLDNPKMTDKFSKDATTSEMLPMLIINNSNDTKFDIESDSDVTTPDSKNTNTRSFLNPAYQLSTDSPTSLEP